MLLIKALFERDNSNKVLEKCLFEVDPTTDKINDNVVRLKSEVLFEDEKIFNNCIRGINNSSLSNDKNRYYKNYQLFKDKIANATEYNALLHSADNFKKFITMFLTRIKVLPIHTSGRDDALTIFETINNRGLSLSDNDILKATLFSSARKSNQEDEFSKRWQELMKFEEEKELPMFLFRNYMWYLRARNKNTAPETALRKFFMDTNKECLDDYNQVVSDLELILTVHEYLENNTDCYILNLINILKTYPNNYPIYPLYIFLLQHGKYIDGEYTLSNDGEIKFKELLEQIVAYSYVKGLVYFSLNAIKFDIFKLCKEIYHNEDYLKTIKDSVARAADIDKAINTLKEQKNIGKYQKGIVFLGASLNLKEDKFIFYSSSNKKVELEHILPKKAYNNYDDFTEQEWKEHINNIGNLIPLEKKLNIKASNEFFNKKKESYKDSFIQDCKEICDYDLWNKQSINHRKNMIISRIEDFFKRTIQ